MFEHDKIELNYLYLHTINGKHNVQNEQIRRLQPIFNPNSEHAESNINKYKKLPRNFKYYGNYYCCKKYK